MEQFEPFVKKNKIDSAGAVAVCEAMAKYSMRFMSVKEVVKIRTVFWAHRVRGLLALRLAQVEMP